MPKLPGKKKGKLTETKKLVNKSTQIYGNMLSDDDTALKRHAKAVDDSNLSKEDKELAKAVAYKSVIDSNDKKHPRNKSSSQNRMINKDIIIENISKKKKLAGKKKK